MELDSETSKTPKIRPVDFTKDEKQKAKHPPNQFFRGLLEIEVTTDHEGTFQTNLFCAVNRCRKQVTILSDGPKTTHAITCVEHGVLTSFPNQFAFREYVRFAANKLLELNGEKLIDFDAFAITSDVEAPPESMN